MKVVKNRKNRKSLLSSKKYFINNCLVNKKVIIFAPHFNNQLKNKNHVRNSQHLRSTVQG